LLESRLIDAVISLPLNVFYGAGVPACLLILRKERPPERHDKVLLVYAARHFRELSAQNELRPQDVMRILVHAHAYGDAVKVPSLVGIYSKYIREQIKARERDEVERLEAEYADCAASLEKLKAAIAEAKAKHAKTTPKAAKDKAKKALAKSEAYRDKLVAKLAERDEKIAEARRRAQDDRNDTEEVGKELIGLYGDENELLKHARVVGIDEIGENEFNLHIPRYVDTFEPEPLIPIADAVRELRKSEGILRDAESSIHKLLTAAGYVL